MFTVAGEIIHSTFMFGNSEMEISAQVFHEVQIFAPGDV